MLGTLTVAGHEFNAYGLFATDAGIYNAPEPDVQNIAIAGRSGDLIRLNNRYKNIPVRYPCVILSELASNLNMIKAYLLSDQNYVRIEDSFDSTHYREGRFIGGTEVHPTMDGTAASFDLEFDCKPQRWLTSGETVQEISASGDTIENPTLFGAKPLIKITGSGAVTLTVGTYSLSISNITDYINLDCETQDAYKTLAENQNSRVTITQGDSFPVLVAGENAISWTGNVTAVEITPGWWEL